MACAFWKLSSRLLSAQVLSKTTYKAYALSSRVQNKSLWSKNFHSSSLLCSSGDKPTFHFMPLSYNEDVRAVSGTKAPDEPPTAPLPEDHELNGDCDFSRQLDMHEDVSDREAFIVTSLLVLVFGGGFYLSEVVYPKERKVTPTELPYLEQDLGGYLKLDETGTKLIPQFDYVTYAAPDTLQCEYLSTVKKKPTRSDVQENLHKGEEQAVENGVATEEADYNKYIHGKQ
eukprot:jgi/Galph1/4342/GphlegSOOS_G2963.1